MTRPRLQRLFWLGAAAILVVAALVALASVARGDFSDTDGRILGTLAVLLLAFATLLSALALADREVKLRPLAWPIAGAAPICFVLALPAIWTPFDEGEGGDDDWRLAWTGILLLIAGLVAATALLLADRHQLRRLAGAAGALAAVAAAVSIAAIWSEDPGDGIAKALAALWILAALAYLLVPVLSRFLAPGDADGGERVLAELDGVTLVATRSSAGEALDVSLRRGERLVLRSSSGDVNPGSG